ncbi:MAG: MFS transporter [Thiovulaceae bacterium]|nr:MFS transporter [Sulfurimonadaceae bacterium]
MKNIKLSLLLLATLTVMSAATIMASLPMISKEFSDIDDIILLSKLMLTLPALFIAILAPFSGALIDRYGRLKSLYFGLALFVIGGTSGIYLNNFWLLLAGRALLGVGVAFVMTASTTLIGDYFEGEARNKFMGLQGAFTAIGGVFFVGGGGLLADIDWRGPFYIYFVPLLFLPLLLKSLYEPKKHHHEEHITPKVFSLQLMVIYITAFLLMIIIYLLPTQMPFLIIDGMGGKPSSVAMIVAFAMSISALTAVNYSKFKRHLSFGSIFGMNFLLLSIGLYLISQATTFPLFFLGAGFTGSGMGLMMVNINSWMLAHAPKSIRGKVTGFTVSAIFLGQFASPLSFEIIIKNLGLQGLFYLVSINLLVIAIMIFTLKLYQRLRA